MNQEHLHTSRHSQRQTPQNRIRRRRMVFIGVLVFAIFRPGDEESLIRHYCGGSRGCFVKPIFRVELVCYDIIFQRLEIVLYTTQRIPG